MYCHWKIRADTGSELLKPCFQILSLPLSALFSLPCHLQEPLVLTRAMENCKDVGCQNWWGGVPCSCSSFGDVTGGTASAEAPCHQRTWIWASKCRDFLPACGQCLPVHHLALFLGLHCPVSWEEHLVVTLGEAGVLGTSLRVEKGS